MKTAISAQVEYGGPDDEEEDDEDEDDPEATMMMPRPSFPSAQESEHG